MKDDLNKKPEIIIQHINAPAHKVIRDPKTGEVKGYDVSDSMNIKSHDKKTPDTLRVINYEPPKK